LKISLQKTHANKTAERKTVYIKNGTKVIIAYSLIKLLSVSKRAHVMLFISAYLTKSVSVSFRTLLIYSGDITTLKYAKYVL